MSNSQTPEKTPTIADLYPSLTKEEQEEAEYHLRGFLFALWDIYQTNKSKKIQSP